MCILVSAIPKLDNSRLLFLKVISQLMKLEVELAGLTLSLLCPVDRTRMIMSYAANRGICILNPLK